MFVVFDLDGTLADDRHRRHMIPSWTGSRPPDAVDWRPYHDASRLDPPVWPLVHSLVAHLSSGHRVEVWTGRAGSTRAETEEWLNRCGVPRRVLVRMRDRGDDGSSPELKRRWLAEEPALPDLAYDDREDCAAVFRAAGVQCLLVGLPRWSALGAGSSCAAGAA